MSITPSMSLCMSLILSTSISTGTNGWTINKMLPCISYWAKHSRGAHTASDVPTQGMPQVVVLKEVRKHEQLASAVGVREEGVVRSPSTPTWSLLPIEILQQETVSDSNRG